jgi:outer membrane protein
MTVKRFIDLIALSSILLLAGCAVNQQREVAHYRRILDANTLPPPTNQLEPSQPLSLEQAMALANASDESLALRGEDYVQALINKNRVVANFLPTVSFQPGFTIVDRGSGTQSNNTPIGTSGAFRVSGDTAHRFEAPVVGSINVFRGFQDVNNLKAAEAIIAQRRELLLDLQSTVLLNVAQVYYQVLRSERAVQVLSNSVNLQEARLTDTEGRFKNGLATRLDVAQTRAQVDASRVQLLQAASDVRNGRSTLASLIGVHSLPNPLVNVDRVPQTIQPEPEFEQRAIDHRHDLIATAHAVHAARANVDAAIGEYYPSVSLNVAGYLYREFFSDASKWNALLQANLPIFSAGLIEADVRTAWSRLRQAALEESATRRDALHDVQIAYENLQTATQRTTQLKDEVAAADEALQQAQQAFHNGLAINLDVLTAQDRLLAAQLDLTGATYDRTVFYLDLMRATGELIAQRTDQSAADAHH